MKKAVFLLAMLGLVIFTCSKKNITNNYYYGPEEEGASVVGVVYPPESKATVTAYLGIPVVSTQIDEVGYFKLSGLPEGSYALLIQAEGYFDHKLSVKLYVENSIIAVDTVYMKSIHDLISSIRPYNGEEDVDVGTSITIQFRNIMKHESVEAAFHINPAVEGSFSWDWMDPFQSQSYVKFTPHDPLATSTVYQVTIDTSASDTSGIKLLEPYQFSFTTEPIRIRNTRPAHNDVWISPMTDIRIIFNCLMNIESVNSAFRLVDSNLNEVTGDLSWIGANYMCFRPSSALATKEEYTASINSTAEDISKKNMPGVYSFSFFTQPILVSYISPSPKSSTVSPYTDIRIVFNTDMDMNLTSAAFHLFDSQQVQVKGSFLWNTPQGMVFNPDTRLNYNETYTVSIDTTAKDLHGKGLNDPFSFWFKTIP